MILGDETTVRSLPVMFGILQSDAKLHQLWEDLKAKLCWSNNTWGTIEFLKDYRLPISHPISDLEGKGITKVLLLQLAKKYLKSKDYQQVPILISVLEKFHPIDNLYDLDP